MASKTTLTPGNLQALGVNRLAALLMEISEGNAALKRRLRLELIGEDSPASLAKEVRKRLATIARSRSFVDWQNRTALMDDLEAQRRAIVQRIAKHAPDEALELIWQFLELANPVHDRTQDSNGTVSRVFHAALGDLGAIAEAARPDSQRLADQAFNALVNNGHGQYDGLVQVLAPTLGPAGLDHLKQRMIALSAEPIPKPPAREREVIGWSSSGPFYADELAESSRVSTVRLALKDIADAQGDVDAYIAQYEPRVRQVPHIAAEIAQRFLAVNRAEDAWKVIEAADLQKHDWPDFGWHDARIDVLEALGRADAAQDARWSCFQDSLSAQHLRDYMKRLPDFDDFEAEQRGLDHAEQNTSMVAALSFLASWPALDRAARVVVKRADELDGNHHEVLMPAAQALAGRYPLSATLLLRAMIDFALDRGRSSRFGHAARHLRDCAGLASTIHDHGGFPTHDAYVAKLRRDHGRKTAFWSAVA